MKSAVLFLVFNRPDKTERAFATIRAARPPRLYVSADGPRPDRPGEQARCHAVREIVTAVDWPCELQTLFRKENLGCKRGVSSGIAWFFENEDEGIILEDDVVPEPSFYRFCDALLERYRDDPRVAAISGSNLVQDRYVPGNSYFFSRYTHVWGWATWRRAWKHYDVTMAAWPAWESAGGLAREFSNASTAGFWRNILHSVHRGEVDTWDFQWLFACWQRGAVCVLPAVNLTRNLGFDGEATHTTGSIPEYMKGVQVRPLEFPLAHPDRVERSAAADRTIDRIVFSTPIMSRLRSGIGRMFKLVGVFGRVNRTGSQ